MIKAYSYMMSEDENCIIYFVIIMLMQFFGD